MVGKMPGKVVRTLPLVYSVPMDNDTAALNRLRRSLGVLPTAIATFRRLDGRTVTLENVNVDSIGPSAANPGVVAVEFEDNLDRIVHLPFIESWEIEYR